MFTRSVQYVYLVKVVVNFQLYAYKLNLWCLVIFMKMAFAWGLPDFPPSVVSCFSVFKWWWGGLGHKQHCIFHTEAQMVEAQELYRPPQVFNWNFVEQAQILHHSLCPLTTNSSRVLVTQQLFSQGLVSRWSKKIARMHQGQAKPGTAEWQL